MTKGQNLFSLVFILGWTLFFANGVSTFLRYTEIYMLVTPKWHRMALSPSYWDQHWKYAPLVKEIGIEGTNAAILTNPFDKLNFDFNLYPRRLSPLNWALLAQYDYVILSNGDPEYASSTTRMAALKDGDPSVSGQWTLFHHHQGRDEYQLWKREERP